MPKTLSVHVNVNVPVAETVRFAAQAREQEDPLEIGESHVPRVWNGPRTGLVQGLTLEEHTGEDGSVHVPVVEHTAIRLPDLR